MHKVALQRHPLSVGDAVRAVTGDLSRTLEGTLLIAYTFEGDLDRVRIPDSRPPRRADRLWEHTCCELFIWREGVPAYYEFNFAPSGEWAAYEFQRYREGMRPVGSTPDPQVTVHRTAGKLTLAAGIRLEQLHPAHHPGAVRCGLSAVVEESGGGLSYWALAHPPGKPDFHHRGSHALVIGPARHPGAGQDPF